MGERERLDLIKKIQETRNSYVITYVLSDRDGYQTSIASDAVRIFYEHLEDYHKKIPRLDLFMYSVGGDTSTPWRIVSLFREFAEEINILIPYKALSAATLVAIGMDNIIMGKKGELGPIDPTVNSNFNPIDPIVQNRSLPINVEDISSYIDLMKKFGITGQKQIGQSFAKLADAVNPIALGYINRHYSFIRMTATKLLKSQKKPLNDQKISHIVKQLIEEIYFHGHGIARMEAKDIGLKIIRPDQKLEELMWKLYLEYENDLQLTQPLNPKDILEERKADRFVMDGVPGAYIESEKHSHVYRGNIEFITKRAIPQTMNINFPLPSNNDKLDFDQLLKLREYVQKIVYEEIVKQSYVLAYDVDFSKMNWYLNHDWIKLV